ncbi:M48 family metalloprotease [Sulfurihydrogenibium azorense]|uniref:beta-barrel assembly-enhancing protease n=1 Tax=Sulfurihydrogenibium azorense TaxID=309806 RepID=UPI00240A3CC8|nr:M48 family metalloprotease [Sulfurihydrogenibium azorense]MDM7272992.1 M48 family metalloprotease [Sulfurihydrogenibium azorense]
MVRKLGIFSLFLLFLVLSCATVQDPLTGKPTFTLLPPEQEIAIGKKVIPQAINENNGLYPDEEVQNYIRKIGYKVASKSPRQVDYQFFLVNSKEVNAFALPGGPVFVNRGLVLILDNESELAGVIAHEVGHITARHHAKFLEKTYGINILLNILAIATSNSQYQEVVMQLAQVSAGLLQLKYSRDQENEADALGVRFTYEAGYDPRGLISTFEKFKSMEKVNAPKWLLTHPLPEDRIKNVSILIETKYPDKLLLKKDSEEFKIVKQKLLKTNESFQLVEDAKENIKNKNFSAALSNLNKAISLFPNNNAAYTYRALVYYSLKDYQKAYLDSVKAYNLDKNYFLPRLILGASLVKMNQYKEAIIVLEDAKKLIDTNPDLYYFLGVAYQEYGDKNLAIENLKTALNLTDGKRGWESDAKLRLRSLGYI